MHVLFVKNLMLQQKVLFIMVVIGVTVLACFPLMIYAVTQASSRFFLEEEGKKQFGSFEAIKWSTIFSPALHATAILCIAGDINVNL